MVVIVLARHGECEGNRAKLLLGRTESPLTERGRAQAEALAAAVAGRVQRVLCSPLGRARETAAAIQAAGGPPIDVDDRWAEADYGRFDGQPLSAVPAEEWRRWQADPEAAPPGGESLAAVGRRVRSALTELVHEGGSGHVLVVSHVSPIKAAVAWALDAGDDLAWRLHLAPGAVTLLDQGPRGPVLSVFGVPPGPWLAELLAGS
ncbi:histidine phosphatase family protein [Aciditerrimonas ferrireducens]|uniref:Histidine phosphatase family protein n=1 Tax=Aciditerrimonas ferrireducens TaxID=667306 RepID=A0ABV6C541_9ACTN